MRDGAGRATAIKKTHKKRSQGAAEVPGDQSGVGKTASVEIGGGGQYP